MPKKKIVDHPKLIKMVKEEDRRKSYLLTARGRQVLAEQIRRLEIMNNNGKSVLSKL